MAPGAQSNIIEWLQRMIGAYTYKTLNTRETKIDMPLFTLRSPRVKGSRVAYEDREENGKPKGWNITVFGAGLGASRELRAEYGMKFYCTGGGCKQIYIPELPVSVIVNEVYKGGAFVREQVTVEVGGLEKERYFEKGIRSCPKHQASDEQSSADKIERFTLTGGVAGETTTYTRRWASSESRDIALEVGVGVLKATVNATIRAEQEIRLTYDLPEGHEYEVRYLAKECGIAWAVKPES
jgi:hypothetical protein